MTTMVDPSVTIADPNVTVHETRISRATESVWDILRRPFPDSEISKLPKVWCKACSKSNTKVCNDHARRPCKVCGSRLTEAHVDLDYVGHADVTSRLIEADPEWSWEPMERDVNQGALAAAIATGDAEIVRMVIANSPPRFDEFGGLWIKLTIAGVTKPGYGDAEGKQKGPAAVKEVIGDAIRNGAMRFGVAVDLWSKAQAAERDAARQGSHTEAPPQQQRSGRADANGDGRPRGQRGREQNGHAQGEDPTAAGSKAAAATIATIAQLASQLEIPKEKVEARFAKLHDGKSLVDGNVRELDVVYCELQRHQMIIDMKVWSTDVGVPWEQVQQTYADLAGGENRSLETDHPFNLAHVRQVWDELRELAERADPLAPDPADTDSAEDPA